MLVTAALVGHDVCGRLLGVKEAGGVVIEAGVIAAYVVAWAIRKARRVAGRLDAEADKVIDEGLDRLHDVVASKLGRHPALADLEDEAGEAANGGAVSDLTRQQVELAVASAARKDETFGRAVTDLLARLREAEQVAGKTVIAGPGSAVFTGDAHARAEGGGIAFGQVAGNVQIGQGPTGPSGPGRPGH